MRDGPDPDAGNRAGAPPGPLLRRGVPLAIFALGLAVRAVFLAHVPERYVVPHTRWELQAIAVSLAETGRFADPYLLPTGATAHLPPIPPALFAAVYAVLGRTFAAGAVAWAIQLVFEAALWASLPWVGARVGPSRAAGALAGTVGALVPHWPGHAEGLTGLALVVLTVAYARRWTVRRASGAGSLALGLGAGAAFHVQPALLAVVLGWMVWELLRGRMPRRGTHAAAVALGIALACLPWAVRNQRALGAAIFVRSNFGLELRMGNHDGAAASMEVMDRQGEFAHPRTHEGEARRVQALGEAAYMREARREAVAWIGAHPATFLRLTASRAAHWWLGPLYDPGTAFVVTAITVLAGVGAWRARGRWTAPERAALLIPLATYPLVYYVVAYMPRYREPIDWIFLLLAAGALLPPGANRPSAVADGVVQQRLDRAQAQVGDPPEADAPARDLDLPEPRAVAADGVLVQEIQREVVLLRGERDLRGTGDLERRHLVLDGLVRVREHAADDVAQHPERLATLGGKRGEIRFDRAGAVGLRLDPRDASRFRGSHGVLRARPPGRSRLPW